MGEPALESTKSRDLSPQQLDALMRLLQEKNDPAQAGKDRPKLGGAGFGGDKFLFLDDPFSKKDRSAEFERQADQINDCIYRRAAAEKALKPEQKDALRLLRRDYTGAKSDDERAKYAKEIEKLVPGSADLNNQIRQGLDHINSIRTLKETPDPQACIRCHPRQNVTYYDPMEFTRGQVARDYNAFFRPRPEDQFEARWAQIANDSPIVKVNETLRHLPPLKVTSDDPVKLVKMGLTVAGVDMNQQTSALIEKAVGGIKGISKEAGNRFVIDREGKAEIPFPEKRYLGAGVELTGLELGPISFTLGEGKYPEIKGIKGLKVKLSVPAALSKIGQISEEAEIKRIFLTRAEGSSDFQVNVEVVNPLPWLVRKAAHQLYKDVPETATVTVPIATLGPDGKPK